MVADVTALVAVFAVIAVIFVYAVATGASPVPTSARVRAVMLDSLPAGLEGVVCELGSGWGTLAFALARRFPRCTVVAYEVSPIPWLASRLRQALRPRPNLAIRRADFHAAPLGDAALVVCYLHPAAMEKLRGKLEAELKPGAWVLSNTFAFRGWRPAAVHTAGDIYRTKVYLYRVES